MTNIQQIAEAFSSHRFTEATEHLAADVRWNAIGQSTLEGRDAVVQACQNTTDALAGVKVEFTRFLSIADPPADAVAVDVIGRYVEDDGSVSVVSSCDIYEFELGKIVAITSYTAELPAD